MKKRPGIPKAVREQVLAEWNHRCSICGGDRPQVHHIDENPENNDPQNLLPLCPNHHLRDQHNPTAQFDQPRLRLFRKFKDPTILSPEFHPLFRRYSFLTEVHDQVPADSLELKANDLITFVGSLRMGDYYSKAIGLLLNRKGECYIGAQGDTYGWQRHLQEGEARYRAQLREAKDQVEDLVIELLRYQDWTKAGERPRTT